MTKHSDIATRALVVSLKAYAGKTTLEVAGLTGLSASQVNRLYARAIERGFDPVLRPIDIKDAYLEDTPGRGRPSKQTSENKDLIVAKLQLDRFGREKTAAGIAAELTNEGIPISETTVLRILKKARFRKTKLTRKPGLTKKMRSDRLQWCLDHQDWTLEDWKKVIWSDETSVVLLYRRGGYRIWRQLEEAFVRSCIRER